MKKNNLLILLVVAVIFTACKKDDDTKISNDELIIGKWEYISTFQDKKSEDWKHKCDSKKDYMWFKKGGKGFRFSFNQNCKLESKDELSWKVDTKNLTLVYSTDSKSPDVFGIVELSYKELKISQEFKTTDDSGEEITEKLIIIFSKI